MKIPKSINIIGFPFSTEKTKENLFLTDGTKCLAKCSLPERKIILKEGDLMDLKFFHEICEARHLVLWDEKNEEKYQTEAMFWLSIFEQLNIEKRRNHGRK